MAAGILRLGNLWVNWLAISAVGAGVRDGTHTLSQRGFQCELRICKWPPTPSSDNSLMIIMRPGLLWWLKLGGIGKGIARLTETETMLTRYNVFVCEHLPAHVQLVWATWLSSGQWDVSRSGINHVWACPLETSHMISQQLSSAATINLGALCSECKAARGERPTTTLNFKGSRHKLHGDARFCTVAAVEWMAVIHTNNYYGQWFVIVMGNVCSNLLPELRLWDSALHCLPMSPLGQGGFLDPVGSACPGLVQSRGWGGTMYLSFRKCISNSILPFHGFLYMTKLTLNQTAENKSKNKTTSKPSCLP